VIRPAHRSDFARLSAIELAAGELFRTVSMDVIADDGPPDLQRLAARVDDGRAWVDVGDDDIARAYLVASSLTNTAHIEQLSVHPAHARKRLGAGLIDHLAHWSTRRGIARLTLTTFREVPWNAPYYARLGFEILEARDQPEWLRELRAGEQRLGLDEWPRVAMAKPLASGGQRRVCARFEGS